MLTKEERAIFVDLHEIQCANWEGYPPNREIPKIGLNVPDNEFKDFIVNAVCDKRILSHPFINLHTQEELGRVVVLDENRLLVIKDNEDVAKYDCTLDTFLSLTQSELIANEHDIMKKNDAVLDFSSVTFSKNEQENLKFQAHFFPSLMKGEFIHPPKQLRKPTQDVVSEFTDNIMRSLSSSFIGKHIHSYLDDKSEFNVYGRIAKCINNTVGQDCFTERHLFQIMHLYEKKPEDRKELFHCLLPDTKTINANLREKKNANYPFINQRFDPELAINYYQAHINHDLRDAKQGLRHPLTTETSPNFLDSITYSFMSPDQWDGKSARDFYPDTENVLVAFARLDTLDKEELATAISKHGIPITADKLQEIGNCLSTTQAITIAEEVLPTFEQQKNFKLLMLKNEKRIR